MTDVAGVLRPTCAGCEVSPAYTSARPLRYARGPTGSFQPARGKWQV